MLTKLERQLTPRRRKWAYGVTAAIVAILVTYRILDGDQAAAWLYLAAATLSMATIKTDTTTANGMPANETVGELNTTPPGDAEGTAGLDN